MWQVANRTPFQAGGTFIRDAHGHEHWCVAIRATFTADAAGRVHIAQEQMPVNFVARYGGSENEVLLAEDDFVPFAPAGDILLHGELQPAVSDDRPTPLTFKVGAVSKQAILHPPRRARLVGRKWKLSDQGRHDRLSLGWQSSFGGSLPQPLDDGPPENPLGYGEWLRAPHQFSPNTETILPRIEAVGCDCMRDPQQSRVLGFGPIPRWWRPRLQLAGTFDDAWRRARSPLMPVDHDPRFACAAPADQWSEKYLKGGEPVFLDGFTGAVPWQFRLPQALFQVETKMRTGTVPSKAHIARLDLFPAESRFSVLWLSTLPCDGRDHEIQVTRVALRQLAGVER
ncbi:DUF2169 family type VI secretion system accessory protein [Paracoccus xiamenensis]|uniref:DUF2169 family type VI secretion system accessory protein n=1 Tax=Paracoccus xiamenensis TaxID=2714901 RepID=UPI00140B0893|nr:DUF2169 domain-containing protein [Paracoccus xiamenensis]NHF74543.1 DUF2169 domain-containing protein [Paracoccus xiamenensis]